MIRVKILQWPSKIVWRGHAHSANTTGHTVYVSVHTSTRINLLTITSSNKYYEIPILKYTSSLNS